MNIRLKKTTIVLFILGILLPISVILINDTENNEFPTINNDLKISTVADKIHINNNWSDSKTAGICTGSGTESDPYIIENLEIDGGGIGDCILIENTTDYFIIENCYVNNTGDNYFDAGIKLIDVDNGQLINNNATGPAFGFFLNRSDNNLIVGNRLTGKGGLYIGICYGTVMYLNNLMGGIYDMFILTKDESTYRFYSPQKALYKYKSNTFKRYVGNYWSGLNPNPDENNDGIGDDPQIYYDSYDLLVDKYPLKEPFESYEIIKFSEDSGVIPGYNLVFLIGMMGIISVFLLHKLKK